MDKPYGRTMDPNKKYNLPCVSGNQKAVRTKKAISDGEHPYSLFNIEALKYASANLSPNGFKIWAILNANKNNYELLLTNKMFIGIMSEKTYRTSIKELIEKGFLRKACLYPNFEGYIFVEGGDQEEMVYQEENDLVFIKRD